MEIEKSSEIHELTPISLNEACVVGSIFFKEYSIEGTESNIRGKETIDSLYNIAEKGCKAAFLITEGTNKKFISDLKERLKPLDEKAENIVWRVEKEHGYSGMRREAVKFARNKYPETRAFIMQELEKDISNNYQEFINALSDNKILVLMNRGVNIPYNENPWLDVNHIGANLPKAQFWGERHQNIEMANQENAAGLTREEHFWDRLNGTRVIRNESINIGEMIINPTDLMLLEYKYIDGYDEKDRNNKIDKYSASVYNLIPILESLGLEDYIAEALTKYWHNETQRVQEEGNISFREKRLRQKNDLPAINFDIVANIKEWNKEGKWPQILKNTLNGNKVLEIRHFNEDEYTLT